MGIPIGPAHFSFYLSHLNCHNPRMPKAVEILLRSKLPPDVHPLLGNLDEKNLNGILAEIARKYPERYEKISHELANIGRNASYNQGETLSLDDLYPVIDKQAIFNQMDKELDALKAADLPPDEFAKARNKVWLKYSNDLEKATLNAGLAAGNNLAYAVASGARGKPQQLKMMLTTPGVYTDSRGDIVPIFIRNGYNEGLRPAEFLAGTYGARLSVVSTKKSTAKGGDFGKQLVTSTTPLMVTEADCGVDNGIDLELDDSSLKNRVLAQDTSGFRKGQVIDKNVLATLRKVHKGPVLARSVMTCQAKQGVCARCVGRYGDDKFPKIGDAAGVTAAHALSEPVTQGALSMKHSGGAASGKKDFSGFDYINQFVQSPEVFPDKAVIAEQDGTVDEVEDAPQGGKYIRIDGEEHYVLPGFEVLVQPGQKVEAGEPLSDGLIDPKDIARLRGIGEARRYYSDRLKQLMDDTGHKADRRNTEMVARAAMDHVVIDGPEGLGDYLPDDVVSYSRLEKKWKPEEDSQELDLGRAKGQYLQKPILHYSIGTRVNKGMMDRLDKLGISKLLVSPTQPRFRPEMVRLRTAAAAVNDDWLAQMHGSYLSQNLRDSSERGMDTNILENTHFVPRLAYGAGFGSKIDQTGKF